MKEDSAENIPEVDAETAKKQLIDMTVNLTRFNVTLSEPIMNESNRRERRNKKLEGRLKQDPVEDEVKLEEKISEKTLKSEVKQTKSSKIQRKETNNIDRPSSRLYQCDLCGAIMPKKKEILSHLRHHMSSVKHKCNSCSERFSTKMKLHHHSMKVHNVGVFGSVEYSKDNAACPICFQVFSAVRLKAHIQHHDAPLFQCEKCYKEFKNQSSMERHKSCHEKIRVFICATCGKGFKKPAILRQHEEVHNPYKIYVVCEICNQMMLGRSLKLHMEVKHGDRYKEKKFICECGKAFRYENQLEKHREAVHEKVTRGIDYPCLECDLSFSRRSDLREHSFEHYSGKIFYCDVHECGMKFKKRKLLTIHSVVHKEITWPCDQCSLTFQTKGGRKKHQTKMHGQVVVEEVIEIPACV